MDSMEASAAPTAGVFCSVLITRCIGAGVDIGVNIDTDIDGDSDTDSDIVDIDSDTDSDIDIITGVRGDPMYCDSGSSLP